MSTNHTPGMLSRLLNRLGQVEPSESRAVVTAFLLFFFVLGGYFAVRPVRETFATVIGRDAVADLWIITSIGAVAIVPVYGALVAWVRRAILLPSIYAFVALSLFALAWFFRANPESAFAAKFFYVYISVLNLMLVSVFWSFLLELFDSGQTKRLFGVIAAGGTAGALVGPLLTDLTVETIGTSGVLALGGAMFVAAIVCQQVLLNIWGTRVGAPAAKTVRGLGGNPFAGFALLFKSRYLLGIALFVVFVSTINTLLYFEQLRLVEERYADLADRTQVFARLDYVVQTLTILSQVFLTGRIATKLGLGVLLTSVPLAMVLVFIGLGLTGGFWVLVVAIVARRWGEYAFLRPGREMLFGRLDTETKYKAKNTIDVPVYRGADLVVAQLNKALNNAGMSAAGIAFLGAGAAALWAVNAWWLGREHNRQKEPDQPAH
ncbi:MAG: MFS transporter [Steroidobacteraceae bacterium]